jgi:hypothetical protein
MKKIRQNVACHNKNVLWWFNSHFRFTNFFLNVCIRPVRLIKIHSTQWTLPPEMNVYNHRLFPFSGISLAFRLPLEYGIKQFRSGYTLSRLSRGQWLPNVQCPTWKSIQSANVVVPFHPTLVLTINDFKNPNALVLVSILKPDHLATIVLDGIGMKLPANACVFQ